MDVQTAEPTLGDTSIVSQSVTIVVSPHMGGTRENWGGGTLKNFWPAQRRHCAPHLQIASDATATLPKSNQEPYRVKEEVGRPGELKVSKSVEYDTFCIQCFDTVGWTHGGTSGL